MQPPSALAFGACGSTFLAGVSLGACIFNSHGDPGPSGGTGASASVSSSSSSSGSGGAGGATSSSAGSGGATSSSAGSGGAGSGGATSSSTGSGGAGTGGATSSSTGAGGGDAGVSTYASCKELHLASVTSPSKVYDLTPPGEPAYQAYCDMGNAGGGWTLVLKIDGTKSTFDYDKALWTNKNAHQPDEPGFDIKEAKLASFWSVPFTELRVGMIDAGAQHWGQVPLNGTSLHALLTTTTPIPTTLGKDFWEGLLSMGSIQTQCTWEGVNANKRVRIGMVGDESHPACDSPDSVIGFGGKGGADGPASGNYADYGPDHGNRMTETFGYVFVR